MSRVLAIGDVHGCARALDVLLADVCPRGGDTGITLGDSVGRGPRSKGVLDRLLDLHRTGRLVALRGNHEIMMLNARRSAGAEKSWRAFGGEAALASYVAGGRPGTLED